jgi:hypothetical protein
MKYNCWLWSSGLSCCMSHKWLPSFEGVCCIYLHPEERGSMFLQNVGYHTEYHIAWQPRKPTPTFSSLW